MKLNFKLKKKKKRKKSKTRKTLKKKKKKNDIKIINKEEANKYTNIRVYMTYFLFNTWLLVWDHTAFSVSEVLYTDHVLVLCFVSIINLSRLLVA